MKKKVLIIEPFYGGSHKQLIDFLINALNKDNKIEVTLETLPDKKWPWRARTSALHFAQKVAKKETFHFLFCSSVLNLAEFVALRPDLNVDGKLKTILYFHENQLAYPVLKEQNKERDFQYGYNQILSALVADQVVFNSRFNLDSFVQNISAHFRLQPDFRPDCVDLAAQIREKSSVLHFPIPFPHNNPLPKKIVLEEENVLHIVWPHRWEHDKNPDSFFKVLYQLKKENIRLRVSVLGQKYSQVPNIFEEARLHLTNGGSNPIEILNWGFLESKEKFYEVLRSAHVAVSTANHEFFGVSMMEAAFCGCFPLVPRRLVYPEIFPDEFLYNTDQQLFKRLRNFSRRPDLLKSKQTEEKIKNSIDVEKYAHFNMKDKYLQLFL